MSEGTPEAGEVWQEADNVLLLCVEPGVAWQDFRGDRVPGDAPTVARPLRRLLNARGELVTEGALRERIAALAEQWVAFDCVALPEAIPASVDVPDDYEHGINDCGAVLRAALAETEAQREVGP